MIDAKEALSRLIDGNLRFVSNQSVHPNRCQETKNKLLNSQTPFAVILSCSDSRVPVEIVFDAGIGDLFVIRTAGHVLSPEVMGSIEYALNGLGVKLVMILGHDNCGAIKTACKSYKDKSLDKLSPYMKSIMSHIYPAIEEFDCEKELACDDVVKANVLYQVKDLLKKDIFINDKVKHHEILVVGANYNLETSQIEILAENG